MIYLDTSVALAHLLSEDRRPADSLWAEPLVSSRLMEFELRVRINARGLAGTHGELVSLMLQRIAFLEMVEPVLERAREPFPIPLRTLDALHLSSILFLQEQGARVRLASYDGRMVEAARALHLDVESGHL